MLATLFCAFCAFCALAIVILALSSFWITLNQGASHVKKLHQIPCTNCDFFTNDYRLKCTINPLTACTEEAIGCRDFEYKTITSNACQNHPRQVRKPKKPGFFAEIL
ncbi:hypothetical protein [Dulcicalothrix desertica]|uniref:hypothetical protein n=1 Tax=Dulcicalothrix desertica TaxID=32056 RepID=UPI000F8C37EB|nr:hypothetical protein [Dulcicalothrix desertica]TWH43186.1 hypothetical protein CAL7102_06886 [Dulcicalothrix desertica PCC 7102]